MTRSDKLLLTIAAVVIAAGLALFACQALARPGSAQIAFLEFATPEVPTEVSVSTTSAETGALTTGKVYRLACNIGVRFRTCTASPCTAVVTDNILPSGAVENLMLKDTEVRIGMITESGTGKCTPAKRE